MTAVEGALPRLSLQQRLQHGLFALAVGVALATGLLSGGTIAAGGTVRVWHLLSGFCTLGLLCYHLLYLAVRGYVEGHGWSSLPLRTRNSRSSRRVRGRTVRNRPRRRSERFIASSWHS